MVFLEEFFNLVARSADVITLWEIWLLNFTLLETTEGNLLP